jgi:hypothetical protein
MLDAIIENWPQIAGVLAAVVLLAERVARLTPTETDNRILRKVKQLADVVGINVPDNPGKPKE